MVLSDQEEIREPAEVVLKIQSRPPRPDLVPAYPSDAPPREDLVPEETLIQKADRSAHEALMGPIEGVANIGAGATGWIGGQAVGYGKLLYDAWRTGGQGVSWQDFEQDFHNASKAISSVGGLYQPQTRMGKDIARLAGMPFEKADKYWGGVVDKLTDNPEINSALKTVGGTAIGLLLGKVIHIAGKRAIRNVKEAVVPPKPFDTAFPTQKIAQRTGAIKEMTDAIKNLKPSMKQQESVWRKQYAQKFAKSKAAAKIGGEKGAMAQIKAMTGEMEKVKFDYEPIRNAFSPEKIDYLYDQITNSSLLDQGQKLTAIDAMKKIFSPEGTQLPQAQSLHYLSRVFGKDFISSVRKNWDTWTKVKHHLVEVINIPRSLKASFDASAPFRQGLYLVGRKEFWSSFKEMLKILEEPGRYDQMMAEIANHKNFSLARDAGLQITEMPSKTGTAFYKPGQSPLKAQKSKMPMREEPYFSAIAEKIPGVGISGELYTGFLNKLRFDTFNSLLKDAEKLGLKSNEKFVGDLATFINSATGRGKLKAREMHTFLNTFLFSPRLLKSRLDMLNPFFYAKLHPRVRREALKSLFTVIGAGGTILGLIKAFDVADVETDPSSADFIKIKPKGSNTRIDIWGGNQQLIVPLYRIATGKYKSSTTGKKSKLGENILSPTRYDIALRSLEYKEAPAFSFLTAMMKGKDARGKPIKVTDEALELVYPLFLNDLADLAKDDPDLIPLGLLGAIGFGLQTYEPRKKLVR